MRAVTRPVWALFGTLCLVLSGAQAQTNASDEAVIKESRRLQTEALYAQDQYDVVLL